jgi:hypothetical protein
LEESQVFSLWSRLGINHLKLRYYSGTTPLLLRCWQSCWQSRTQEISVAFVKLHFKGRRTCKEDADGKPVYDRTINDKISTPTEVASFGGLD